MCHVPSMAYTYKLFRGSKHVLAVTTEPFSLQEHFGQHLPVTPDFTCVATFEGFASGYIIGSLIAYAKAQKCEYCDAWIRKSCV